MIQQHYALAWLNMATLALIPVLVTMCKVKASITSTIAAAQAIAHRGCDDMNAAATRVVSIPAVLRERAYTEMQTTADNLLRGLITAINTLEGIVLWIIGLYKSTFRCLLGLAVNGVMSVVTKIAGPVQETAENILQGGANVLQQLVGNNRPNQQQQPNVSLGDWAGGMQNVQQKVEQWTKGENDPLNALVSVPFEKIKEDLQASLGQWKPPHYNNNETGVIPSSSDEKMHATPSWCTAEPLVNALDDTKTKLHTVICICIVIVVLFIVMIICINMLYMRRRSQFLTQWRRQLAYDLTHDVKEQDHALRKEQHALDQELALFGDAHQHAASTLFDPHSRMARWIRALTIHRYAVYCLLVGVVGLVGTYTLHVIIDKVLVGLTPGFDAAANAWTSDVAGSATSSALQQLDTQLEEINSWITQAEQDINGQAFGVVRSIATAANSTLGVVTQHVTDFVQTTLGGTILEQPAKDVLDCVMMLKINKIEQGLGYIVQHAHVNLTRYEAADVRTTIQSSLQDMEIAPIHDMWQSLNDAVTRTIQGDLTLYWVMLAMWCLAVVCVLLTSIINKALLNKK
ncbi:predicted protein [Lichtheimia corymbifera JMRC:FSU:9682]|uniref:Plasma membrane fusion protein PRM1 n=1 Tax=Lichtheimia corymbifera JMRC:FSU:9682 TaxID=1263082 RepID=A0A068SDJ5_9FUNG|nr:predicted protein [Lichtheimia corymbifera JMRC:FSU:9682]